MGLYTALTHAWRANSDLLLKHFFLSLLHFLVGQKSSEFMLSQVPKVIGVMWWRGPRIPVEVLYKVKDRGDGGEM